MSDGARLPRRRQRQFVLPVGTLVRAIAGVLAVFIVGGLFVTGAFSRVANGSLVADSAAVAEQQATAVRDLERGYEQTVDQVKKARALRLAITAPQADAIANKALGDLFTLRHSALLSLAQLLGSSGDPLEAYAKSTEQALDAKAGQQPTAPPVLLAPRLYAIVSRFNDLATQLADKATADLTQPATPAPSPRPGATPSPTPTR